MKALSLLLLIAILIPAAFAQTPVVVQNNSFETYNPLSTSNNCPDGSLSKWNYGPVPAWTTGGSGLSGTLIPGHCVYVSIPNGAAIFYTDGPSLTQDLGTGPAVGVTYTVTAYVGHRLNGNIAQSSMVSLLVGSTVGCSSSVLLASIPPGAFQAVSCSYTTPAVAPVGNLKISLSTVGTQSNFDNVSLTSNAHHATLSWQDSVNPSGTQYNIYRSSGNCPLPAGGTPIASGVATLGSTPLVYVDGTILQNQGYCYGVSATFGGTESLISSTIYVPTAPANVVAN